MHQSIASSIYGSDLVWHDFDSPALCLLFELRPDYVERRGSEGVFHRPQFFQADAKSQEIASEVQAFGKGALDGRLFFKLTTLMTI